MADPNDQANAEPNNEALWGEIATATRKGIANRAANDSGSGIDWDALGGAITESSGSRIRERQQMEAGANSRARMAAGASTSNARTAANASMANARLAAEAQRYGIDVNRLTDQEKIALSRELGLEEIAVKREDIGLRRELGQAQIELQRYGIDTTRLTAQEQIALSRELGLGQQEISKGQLALQGELGRGELGLKGQDIALREKLGMGQLGLGEQELGLQGELGRGRLGLESELGRGNLALGQQRFGLESELGRGRLGLESELGRGDLALRETLGLGQLGLSGQELALRGELGRGQLGLGMAQAAASLRGPQDYFQYANFMRGVENTPVPGYLGTLLGGQSGAGAINGPTAMQATPVGAVGLGGGGTQAATLQGILGGAAPQAQAANQLAAFQPLLRNIGGAGPQALESLSPTEMGLTESAAGASGMNWQDILKQYRQSRFANPFGAGATAA